MSRLPPMTYRKVVRLLRAAGFVFDRQAKGSHEIWRSPQTRRRVTVPNHPGTLPRGTLRAIIRQNRKSKTLAPALPAVGQTGASPTGRQRSCTGLRTAGV